MKVRLIIVFLCVLAVNLVQGQEIEHEHSIHHAFIENKGQWKNEVLFKTKFSGGNLWIQQHKFVFHLQDFSALKAIHGNPKDGKPKRS